MFSKTTQNFFPSTGSIARLKEDSISSESLHWEQRQFKNRAPSTEMNKLAQKEEFKPSSKRSLFDPLTISNIQSDRAPSQHLQAFNINQALIPNRSEIDTEELSDGADLTTSMYPTHGGSYPMMKTRAVWTYTGMNCGRRETFKVLNGSVH